MSWSRRHLLLAALLPVAGGCVVRPLYGTASGAGTGAEANALASVLIQPIPDRRGQMLHNALRDMLNPRGQPAEPRYELAVSLQESVRESGLRRSETATRGTMTLRADYRLLARSDGSELTSGRAQSIIGYNLVESGYANHVSAGSAQERGVQELAQEIRRRLALYLAEPDD